MSGIEKSVRQGVKKKGICFMGHVIAGYPSFEDNEKIISCLVENGADLIEIQMPFSEPAADGELFAEANQKSLDGGTTLKAYFDFAGKMSKKYAIPFIFMGYYNIVFQIKERIFCEKMIENGLQGVIIPDLPYEHGGELIRALKERDLSFIPVISQVTPPERGKELAKTADDLVYLTARKGVTGRKTSFSSDFEKYLQWGRECFSCPLGVGFGISEKGHVEMLRNKAEVVIIGSAILKNWLKGGEKQLKGFLKNLFSN